MDSIADEYRAMLEAVDAALSDDEVEQYEELLETTIDELLRARTFFTYWSDRFVEAGQEYAGIHLLEAGLALAKAGVQVRYAEFARQEGR